MPALQPDTYRSRSYTKALAVFAWKRITRPYATYRRTGTAAPIHHVVWA